MSDNRQNYGTSQPIDENWWKMWRNRRYHVAIMCFFGMMNMYICRVNMSVAVVAMTKNVTSSANGSTTVSEFSWNSSEKSVILSSFYYGYVPIQVVVGILLKYVSPYIIFGIGTAVPGVITILTPLIATHLPLWVLVTTRVAIGLLQGGAVPCLIKFWTIWGPPLERSRLHGIAVSGAFVGTVIGLPLSGVLADHAGWESIFYVIGSIPLVWYIVWLILIRKSPKNDSFISMYEKNYIAVTIEKQNEKNSHPIPWISISRSIPIYGVLIACAGWGWGYVTMLTQLPQFLFDIMNFDLSKSGFLSALPYLTMAIMSLLGGYIADYILVRQLVTATRLRKYYISLSMLFQAAFILIAAYVFNPTVNIICICAGIGMGALTYSGIGMNFIDIAPAFAAVIGGLGNTLASIPGIVSPLITGIIVQSDSSHYDDITFQWRVVFFITAGMYVMGSILYWFLGSAEMQDWSKFNSENSDVHYVDTVIDPNESYEIGNSNYKSVQ